MATDKSATARTMLATGHCSFGLATFVASATIRRAARRIAIPQVDGPDERARLPDASQERPVRPKQFLPPRAMKIDG